MSASDFKPLGYYLRLLLEQHGLSDRLLEAEIPERFRALVGEAIARRLESVTFYNGELHIRTTSPIWRLELRLRAETLRKRLNTALGKEVVRSITVT